MPTLLVIFLLELRSIIRNRRLRMPLVASFLIALTGKMLMINTDEMGPIDYLATCILVTTPITAVGQFIFSKDASFHSVIATLPISRRTLLWSKIITLYTISITGYCLFFLVPEFVPQAFLFHIISIFVYTSGVGIPAIVMVGSYDTSRIDYNRSAFFNYEGVSFWRQIVATPPFLLLILVPDLQNLGILLTLIVGVASALLMKLWVKRIVLNLQRRKYLRLEGFRECPFSG